MLITFRNIRKHKQTNKKATNKQSTNKQRNKWKEQYKYAKGHGVHGNDLYVFTFPI